MDKVKNQLKTVQKRIVALSKQQLKKQLVTASKSLVSLSKQLDKISMHVDKLQAAEAAAKKKPVAKKKPIAKKKPVAKKKPIAKKKPVAKKKPAIRKKAGVKKPVAAKGVTVLDTVFDAIKRSKKGITIEKIKEKTGLDGRKLSNALYKLTKQGKIKTASRGVYMKK
jgi:predicted Rossmann fold nucleotide-binding protein DprA/Smf involved in DNA uptake